MYDSGSSTNLSEFNNRDDACVFRALLASAIDMGLRTKKLTKTDLGVWESVSQDYMISKIDKKLGTRLAQCKADAHNTGININQVSAYVTLG